VVDITDIPDFLDGSDNPLPGQRPVPDAPTTVDPVPVVLVTAKLDKAYRNRAFNSDAVDDFITAEITAGRAYVTTAERWNPWSDLQLPLDFATGVAFNYARFTLGGRSWYAFLDAQYLNLTDTLFLTTEDAWTTYNPSVGFSTVIRAHVAVAAAADAGSVAEAWSYCQEPEGFEPGELISYGGFTHDPLGNAAVLVVSATDLTANPFVAVDADVIDTMEDTVTNPQANGTVTAEAPTLGPETFNYVVGNSAYDDLFYYPYAESAGLSGGAMMRPFTTGASPSMIDGLAAEGGAFVYDSVLAYVEHMALLGHVPWIAEGIVRAVEIPGGDGGSGSGVPLTPWDHVQDVSGSAAYHSTLSTAESTDTVLTTDFRALLPSEHTTFVKLETAPYTMIQIGSRTGSTEDYAPQGFSNAPEIRLHTEGAYYPHADVVSWLTDANYGAAQNDPIESPLATDLPHFIVGRDAVYASGAAGIAAERAQAIYDELLSEQKTLVDAIMTRSSTYTATQYAIAEAV
jgi:hypothetical protein